VSVLTSRDPLAIATHVEFLPNVAARPGFRQRRRRADDLAVLVRTHAVSGSVLTPFCRLRDKSEGRMARRRGPYIATPEDNSDPQFRNNLLTAVSLLLSATSDAILLAQEKEDGLDSMMLAAASP
jgi:hypothetical protein